MQATPMRLDYILASAPLMHSRSDADHILRSPHVHHSHIQSHHFHHHHSSAVPMPSVSGAKSIESRDTVDHLHVAGGLLGFCRIISTPHTLALSDHLPVIAEITYFRTSPNCFPLSPLTWKKTCPEKLLEKTTNLWSQVIVTVLSVW